MTNAEADSDRGKKLLNLIFDVCHDGALQIDEVARLHAFLVEPPVSFAAIGYLRAITRQIVADDRIDDLEAYELKQAFARITPKNMRDVILTHLESIGLPLSGDRFSEKTRRDDGGWRTHPATRAQVEYIANLGGKTAGGITKGEASELIEQLLEHRPPTPRQQMILRFFDRLDLSRTSKSEVSVWIDAMFADETSQECKAWERFKRDTNHDPHDLDIEVVPIGAYLKYKQSVRRPSSFIKNMISRFKFKQ